MKSVKVSDIFRCAECNTRLLEVREKETDNGHNLRCPRCDRDLQEREGW